jgi:plasmid stabilization system protein ParE
MVYLVSTTSGAERDLADLYRQVNAAHSDTAWQWYLGIKEAILSLEHQPNRCSLTRKKSNLRHLLYGHNRHIYRIIYGVIEKEKQVQVVHIRHGARRNFRTSDLM